MFFFFFLCLSCREKEMNSMIMIFAKHDVWRAKSKDDSKASYLNQAAEYYHPGLPCSATHSI